MSVVSKATKEEIRLEVAENLLFYRKKNELTQKELADKLGVKGNTITSWEKGVNSIDIDTLFRICEVFDISIDDMYGKYALKRQVSLSRHEIELIEAYRNQAHLQEAVDKVLSIQQNKYEQQREEKLKKIVKPYAAAGGDTSNLDEAQALYDEAQGNGKDK